MAGKMSGTHAGFPSLKTSDIHKHFTIHNSQITWYVLNGGQYTFFIATVYFNSQKTANKSRGLAWKFAWSFYMNVLWRDQSAGNVESHDAPFCFESSLLVEGCSQSTSAQLYLLPVTRLPLVIFCCVASQRISAKVV